MTHDDLYFGCWGNQPGHDLRTPDGARHSRLPFGYPPKLDGIAVDMGFTPGVLDISKRPRDPGTIPNGAAALHHVSEWTVLSFWDNSIDTRPGSHSTFISRGTLTFEGAVVRAKAAFPSVWKRFTFEVRPR